MIKKGYINFSPIEKVSESDLTVNQILNRIYYYKIKSLIKRLGLLPINRDSQKDVVNIISLVINNS